MALSPRARSLYRHALALGLENGLEARLGEQLADDLQRLLCAGLGSDNLQQSPVAVGFHAYCGSEPIEGCLDLVTTTPGGGVGPLQQLGCQGGESLLAPRVGNAGCVDQHRDQYHGKQRNP